MKETRVWRAVKYLLTIFMIVLVPVYWRHYGPLNFLWLSDIGLFLTTFGLWLHKPILVSMAVVGVMAMELAWCVDYFLQLFFVIQTIHLADYMFDRGYPLMLRGLSLFHVAMPIIWILYLIHYGYDRRAFWYTTFLYWVLMIYTYTLTDPAANVNWVYLPVWKPDWGLSTNGWLILLVVLFPLCVFLPTHYMCTKFFRSYSKN